MWSTALWVIRLPSSAALAWWSICPWWRRTRHVPWDKTQVCDLTLRSRIWWGALYKQYKAAFYKCAGWEATPEDSSDLTARHFIRCLAVSEIVAITRWFQWKSLWMKSEQCRLVSIAENVREYLTTLTHAELLWELGEAFRKIRWYVKDSLGPNCNMVDV